MIYTGNYKKCKSGNLISISGDRGRKENFSGKYIRELAPKLSFWKIWESNIGKISEYENTKYYIESYYKEVLSKVEVYSPSLIVPIYDLYPSSTYGINLVASFILDFCICCGKFSFFFNLTIKT